MRRIAVGDVMTRNFVSVNSRATLHECAKKMARERVNSIIISESGRLIGILTARDILWVITKKPGLELKKMRGVDIATRKLAVIKPSADISQALEKMRASNYRRLPVLANGKLIGVVTLKDILAVQPELYQEVQNVLDEVKEGERKKERAEGEWDLEGLCENCGAFSELLRVEGNLLCPDCRDELY